MNAVDDTGGVLLSGPNAGAQAERQRSDTMYAPSRTVVEVVQSESDFREMYSPHFQNVWNLVNASYIIYMLLGE